MSEQMQPGRELDRLVAEVMGYSNIHWTDTEYGLHPFGTEPGGGQGGVMLPFFSEDNKAAMQAWAWLEENHPWVEQHNAWPWQQGIKAAILLGRDYIGQEDNPRPSVLVMQRADWWYFPDSEIEEGTKEGYCFYIPGDTYPHAISLTVLAAKRARPVYPQGGLAGPCV